MGNISTVPVDGSLRCTLDKGSYYSYEPMGERDILSYCRGPQPFLAPEPVLWKTVFPWMGVEWLRDDSSALHLLHTLPPLI